MCGIVGFLDRTEGAPAGRVVLTMLRALACRGPDSAGVAVLGDEPAGDDGDGGWTARLAFDPAEAPPLGRLAPLGRVTACEQPRPGSLRLRFVPGEGVTPDDVEAALGARRGGLEVLSLGARLDLVKQVGSPDALEATYGVSSWRGPVAIGHTRMSTESRIDLSHSQPFWAHGVPDLATVHNGHVTNYHLLRRRYEQQGVTFYTDNDSEVIGVYLRDRLSSGRTLPEALADSVRDLDGAFNYLVVSPEGLGVVRDRFGFKPLVVAETAGFVAAATEEQALRRALPGGYRAAEPRPGTARLYRLETVALV
jgi:glutamine phosphoribosylpyrophosphate amidotransferase